MANVTVLPEDYEGLKREYLILRKELDTVHQDLYECNRHLKNVEVLEQEYQSEMDILQSEQNAIKLKYEEKIVQLEDTVSSIKCRFNEQIHILELELTSKDEEIEKYKSEIEVLKKSNIHSPSEDVNKLFEEISELRHQNETLQENEAELKFSLEALQKSLFSIEEALTESKHELSELKESLSCKRDELMEANDLVQKLNDELFCLRSELESYKNKPLNADSKGNSLFAEVDDRRVYLQKIINSMKADYIAMKQERARHLNMISHLKKENMTVCKRWKLDIEEKEDDEHMVLKSYKDRIEILDDLVEKYKRDLAAKPLVISTGSFSEIEFYQTMLKNKTKDLEETRDQLRNRGLSNLLLATSLNEANKEIRKWRLEATLKQYQLESQPGGAISESSFMKQIEEQIDGPRVELKQNKKGPKLACKKEAEKDELEIKVTEKAQKPINTKLGTSSSTTSTEKTILIDDSVDDVEIVEAVEAIPHKEDFGDGTCAKDNTTLPGILKESKENVIKTYGNDKTEREADEEFESGIKEDTKECLSSEKENVSRRVTFSQSTVSPKLTDRTVLRKNCKRIVVPKAIYIPSE